jgi:hypothetical protein
LVTSYEYQAPVVPAIVLVATGVAPAAGLVFHVNPDSLHVVEATGYSPIATLGSFVSSIRPKTRTSAAVI